MPRYKLIIEYDGAPFCGWQIQADQLTVQGVLTAAIEALSGEKVLVQGAGRTDAGVHARGAGGACRPDARMGHATRCATRSTPICARIRSPFFPPKKRADDFNARTSAVKRHYLYRIINRRPDLTLRAGRAWRVPRPLDAGRCTPPRNAWSASTISPPSARPNARPTRR